MEQVEVVKYQMYRDGGTTEYRDIHNRQYYVPAPIFNDTNIYGSYPYHRTKSQEYRDDVILKGIELEIVNKL